MQLPYFFEEKLPEGTGDFELSADTSKHIIQVLRMKKGDALLLTDGKGSVYNVTLLEADKKHAKVSFNNKTNHLAQDNQIAIAISLLKNENRFEWFVEKAAELGINRICPIICKRTEKKSFRKERMKNILVSAMLQSRQVFLPELSDPVKLEDLLKTESHYDQKFIAHCIDDQDEKAELDTLNQKNISKLILIGPEGDFTEEELKESIKSDFVPVSLGNTRLRTETAGIVAAVLLLI